jgi:hypothetical protein
MSKPQGCQGMTLRSILNDHKHLEIDVIDENDDVSSQKQLIPWVSYAIPPPNNHPGHKHIHVYCVYR